MKRALIFYHSPTGNTRWVAERIAVALSACGIETVCRSIAGRPDTSDLMTYGLLGFGCPVMGFRPSFALSRFLQSLPVQPRTTPAFTFVTYAGVRANSAWTLSRMLHDRGFAAVDHAHFRGEVSWPIARAAGLIVNRGLPGERQLPEIRGFAERLAALVEQHQAGRTTFITAPYSRWNLFHHLSLLNSPARLRYLMGVKKVNAALCTRCGRCEENCAAAAITLSPHPVFSNRCDGCWGCFNLCPAGAISSIVGIHGRYRARETPLRLG